MLRDIFGHIYYINKMSKKDSNAKKVILGYDFDKLPNKTSLSASQPVVQNIATTNVNQEEFEDHTGNKKEIYEFLQTGNLFMLILAENIFLPPIDLTNND